MYRLDCALATMEAYHLLWWKFLDEFEQPPAMRFLEEIRDRHKDLSDELGESHPGVDYRGIADEANELAAREEVIHALRVLSDELGGF